MSDEQDKQSSAPVDDGPVVVPEGETATIPRKGRTATMILALVLLLGLAGWATWPYWAGHVPAPIKETMTSLFSGLSLPPLTTNRGAGPVGGNTPPSPSPSSSVPDISAPPPVAALPVEPSPEPVAPSVAEPPSEMTPAPVMPQREAHPPVTALDPTLQGRLNRVEQGLGQVRDQLARQEDLTRRLEALEGRDHLSEGLVEQVDGLSRQLDGLTRQVAQLQQSSAAANTVLALSERVSRLERTQAQNGLLLLATVQLHNAVQSGRDFTVELQAVRTLGKDHPEVAKALSVLEPYQQTGIQPFGRLMVQFEELEPVAIRAGLLPEQNGWWRQTLDHLFSLVVVRREDGTQAGDRVTAFLGRASEAMARHDLVRAAEEVAGITDMASAVVMGPWLEQARIHNQAEAALSNLTSTLLAVVGSAAQIQTSGGN